VRVTLYSIPRIVVGTSNVLSYPLEASDAMLISSWIERAISWTARFFLSVVLSAMFCWKIIMKIMKKKRTPPIRIMNSIDVWAFFILSLSFYIF